MKVAQDELSRVKVKVRFGIILKKYHVMIGTTHGHADIISFSTDSCITVSALVQSVLPAQVTDTL